MSDRSATVDCKPQLDSRFVSSCQNAAPPLPFMCTVESCLQNSEGAFMTVQKRASVVEFAPKRAGRDSVRADDAGNGIIALLHKAAETAKEDCARAMDSDPSFLFSYGLPRKGRTSLRPRPITFPSGRMRQRNG